MRILIIFISWYAALEVTILKFLMSLKMIVRSKFQCASGQDFSICSAFGHALFSASAKIISNISAPEHREGFSTCQNDCNGHIYEAYREKYIIKGLILEEMEKSRLAYDEKLQFICPPVEQLQEDSK